MTMRTCLLYLLLASSLWALAGCGDVESCLEMDTPGCLNSAPRPSGAPCLYDLVVVNGKCLKSGGEKTPCGVCEHGALCDEKSKTCVNFCDVPTVLPGSIPAPEPIFCEAIKSKDMPNPPMLTFAEVCQRRCRLNCQRLEQFCPGYKCPPGACDGQDVQNKCLQDCPAPGGGGNDLACLTLKCNDVRFATCTSGLACPNGATPNCARITCTNNCQFDGKNVTGDGYCDDGDTFSSVTAQCAWGSDCVDCGPRMDQEVLGNLGDLCQYHLNCLGGTGSPDTAGAWCVTQSTPALNMASRCMPDCSRTQGCAPGFLCRSITITQADGSAAPVMAGGYSSQACLPDACL